MTFHRFVVLAGLLALACSSATRADDWPQWLGPQRDGVWRESGILEKFPADGPKVRWRTPIGAGYAGPAVSGGKVYITDRILDKGVANPKNPFARDVVNGAERILCLDEKTGKIEWEQKYRSRYQISYPSGPRTTPVVADGKVFWKKNFMKEFDVSAPVWGFAAHPLLDGDKLICVAGGKGSVAVAFHKDTGKIIWKALSAREPGYCPPMIFTVGGKRQLIIWHPEAVNGLDPETGKVYWSIPWRVRSALTIPTPRLNGTNLFLTSFYNGSMMLDLKKDASEPAVVWKGKHWNGARGAEQPNRSDGLHAIMCTPYVQAGHIYGVGSYGELRCLKADSGKRIWMTLKATGSVNNPTERWANAFIVAQGKRFFIPNEKGDLIIARLTPEGYEEISRAHILDPQNRLARGRRVNWSHPAFANKCMYARNDKEIVCVSLEAK